MKSPFRRWLGRFGILCFPLFVVTGLLLVSGIPQRKAAEFVLERILDADVHIGAMPLVDRVLIDELQVINPMEPATPIVHVSAEKHRDWRLDLRHIAPTCGWSVDGLRVAASIAPA